MWFYLFIYFLIILECSFAHLVEQQAVKNWIGKGVGDTYLLDFKLYKSYHVAFVAPKVLGLKIPFDCKNEIWVKRK